MCVVRGTIPSPSAPSSRKPLRFWRAIRKSGGPKTLHTTATGLRTSLTMEELAELPRLLVDRRAVLFDRQRNALLYVFDPPERTAGKIVVGIDYKAKLAGAGKQIFNGVQTVTLTETQNLLDEVNAGTLELLDGRL